MKSVKIIIGSLFASIFLLPSCCHTYDSEAPPAFPYGNDNELNFTLFKSSCLSSFGNYLMSKNIDSIFDKPTCDSLMIKSGSTCNCDDIDFNKDILIRLNGIIIGTYTTSERKYYPRTIINHKTKTCTVELRGSEKKCSLETNLGGTNSYKTFLKIPRPPKNYRLNIDYLYPVEDADVH